MYQMSPVWQEYYIQLEPDRRKELLHRLLKEEADDGANAVRQKLFSLRYMEEGKTEPSVDRWLWACVNFVQVFSTSRFLKRGGRKEVEQFLDSSGYREALSAGRLPGSLKCGRARRNSTVLGDQERRETLLQNLHGIGVQKIPLRAAQSERVGPEETDVPGSVEDDRGPGETARHAGRAEALDEGGTGRIPDHGSVRAGKA